MLDLLPHLVLLKTVESSFLYFAIVVLAALSSVLAKLEQNIQSSYLEVSRVELLSLRHEFEQLTILERVLEPLFEKLNHQNLVAQIFVVSKVHQDCEFLDLFKAFCLDEFFHCILEIIHSLLFFLVYYLGHFHLLKNLLLPKSFCLLFIFHRFCNIID